MQQCIMVGCDVHDRSLVVKAALGRQVSQRGRYGNDGCGRGELVAWLKGWAATAGADRIVLAYEASSQGFGLYDELTASGIGCVVVPPTRLRRTVQESRQKTDAKDAEALLELVRGHELAGNALPRVWVPDRQTRDDREVVRSRIDVAEKIATVKTQIRMLLKRRGVSRPSGLGGGWTRPYRGWLAGWAESQGDVTLGTLVRQLAFLESERQQLDGAVAALAQGPRYASAARALQGPSGVGVLTAMVFLTELGDLSRFSNRRQVGAYLGLTPRSWETGEASDRKGRITHQGPWRVRRVLCQAAHAWLRSEPLQRAAYQRLVAKHPRKQKKAIVAAMRRLGIRLWHLGLAAQRRDGVFATAA